MPTKEVVVLKKDFKGRKAALRNFEIAWHHLSPGWKIIMVLGILTAIWIVFKLISSLRLLYSAG